MSIYDLLEINVGQETLQARPIEWSGEIVDGYGNDSDGELVKAIKWMTTCPECADLIEFESKSIFVIDDDKHVICQSCNMKPPIGASSEVDLSRMSEEQESKKTNEEILEEMALAVEVPEGTNPFVEYNDFYQNLGYREKIETSLVEKANKLVAEELHTW